jgi:hypothetical protein
MQKRRFGQPLTFDELTEELTDRLDKIQNEYAIESDNKRYDRSVERAFDETITINKPTATQRHELALLVDHLNQHDLTYADVLEQLEIPNVNKVLTADELEKVAQTGFEFEKKTGLSGNTGSV